MGLIYPKKMKETIEITQQKNNNDPKVARIISESKLNIPTIKPQKNPTVVSIQHINKNLLNTNFDVFILLGSLSIRITIALFYIHAFT